jgi:hypothetical protein
LLAARTLSHADVASKAVEVSAHDPNGYPTTFAYQWTRKVRQSFELSGSDCATMLAVYARSKTMRASRIANAIADRHESSDACWPYNDVAEFLSSEGER